MAHHFFIPLTEHRPSLDDMQPMGLTTTADILNDTRGALQTTRDYLDRIGYYDDLFATRLREQLRTAIIALCQATAKVIYEPGKQELRQKPAAAARALLAANETTLDYLESHPMPTE